MGRNKTRWPLELDSGLLAALEDTLADQQKTEAGLNRNEFLCRLLRRSLSQVEQSPAVSFVTASRKTMAEFRGDMDRLQRHFVNIRNAIVNRNRCLDKNDPESVKRYDEDDVQTKNFLAECNAILAVAKDRAWTLRGFSEGQIRAARRFLAEDLQERLEWAEGYVTWIRQQLEHLPDDLVGRVGDEEKMTRLDLAIQRVNALKCALSLLTLGENLAPTPPQMQGSKPSPSNISTAKKVTILFVDKNTY